MYLRVSTTRQADEGNSLATQESLLLRYAKQRGYSARRCWKYLQTNINSFRVTSCRVGKLGVLLAKRRRHPCHLYITRMGPKLTTQKNQ